MQNCDKTNMVNSKRSKHGIFILGIVVLLCVVPMSVVAIGTQEKRAQRTDSSKEIVPSQQKQLFPETGSVLGQLIDENGVGIPANLQLCGSVCWPAASDVEGNFSYVDVFAETYLLRITTTEGCAVEENPEITVVPHVVTQLETPLTIASCS